MKLFLMTTSWFATKIFQTKMNKIKKEIADLKSQGFKAYVSARKAKISLLGLMALMFVAFIGGCMMAK